MEQIIILHSGHVTGSCQWNVSDTVACNSSHQGGWRQEDHVWSQPGQLGEILSQDLTAKALGVQLNGQCSWIPPSILQKKTKQNPQTVFKRDHQFSSPALFLWAACVEEAGEPVSPADQGSALWCGEAMVQECVSQTGLVEQSPAGLGLPIYLSESLCI